MIDYISIRNTLILIDTEYSSCTGTQLPILYSKLAVLELCGWIETNIDNLLFEYVNNHIIDNDCKKGIKRIIDKNYGFDYNNNLFPLFCSVLGINNLENILDKLNASDLQNLKSITEAYTKERNKAAHTDTPIGTTRSYKSPSNVLYDFNLIKTAFQTIETQIQLL